MSNPAPVPITPAAATDEEFEAYTGKAFADLLPYTDFKPTRWDVKNGVEPMQKVLLRARDKLLHGQTLPLKRMSDFDVGPSTHQLVDLSEDLAQVIIHDGNSPGVGTTPSDLPTVDVPDNAMVYLKDSGEGRNLISVNGAGTTVSGGFIPSDATSGVTTIVFKPFEFIAFQWDKLVTKWRLLWRSGGADDRVLARGVASVSGETTQTFACAAITATSIVELTPRGVPAGRVGVNNIVAGVSFDIVSSAVETRDFGYVVFEGA